MKYYLLDKLIVITSILSLLVVAPPLSYDTIKDKHKTDDKNSTVINEKKPVESLDVNTILAEAKETVTAYNKAVEEKNKQSKRLLFLSRKELNLVKEQQRLIREIINDINQKNKLVKNAVITEVQKDSICTDYRKPLFGKEKCIEWEVSYYLYLNKERVNIFSQKSKQ